MCIRLTNLRTALYWKGNITSIERVKCGRWHVRITRDSKRLWIGSFSTKRAARIAFDQVELAYLACSDAMFVYKLRSPDFMGLKQIDISAALGVPISTLQSKMRDLKKKLPELFPLHLETLLSGRNSGLVCCPVSYSPEMDGFIKEKF